MSGYLICALNRFDCIDFPNSPAFEEWDSLQAGFWVGGWKMPEIHRHDPFQLLVDRVKQGDSLAWSQFIEQYDPKLRRVIPPFTGAVGI